MYDTTRPVPGLEARLAAAERTLAALEARRARPRRRPRATRALGALLVAVLLAAVPLALVAATPFTDLNPGSIHNGDIDLIYNAGVTLGCTATTYCPNDPVTREQMATFLARLGGLGSNPPVVNAATLDGVSLADIQSVPGPAGPTGPVGPVGPSGPVGPAGASDSLGVNQGAGIAGATGPNTIALPILLLNIDTSAGMLTIEAPRDGYVLVTGKVGIVVPLAMVAVTTRVQHINSNTYSSGRLDNFNTIALGQQTVAETWVFPVLAGTNTFQMAVQSNFLGTVITQADMTGLFVSGPVGP